MKKLIYKDASDWKAKAPVIKMSGGCAKGCSANPHWIAYDPPIEHDIAPVKRVYNIKKAA